MASRAKGGNPNQAVVRVEVETKASIWQFQHGQTKRFLKLVMNLPNNVAPCRCGAMPGLPAWLLLLLCCCCLCGSM